MLVSLGLLSTAISCLELTTKGEFIGGYKSVSTKTTYDPKILPDSKVADMSSRAAVQAESVFKANPALRETSIKVDGYYFQVTRNSKTGEITNSFIAMPPRIK
ncbi:hypothetical protein I5K09_28965 [Pseudomonas aeruginosa]|uniref:Uncharacterized protein n=1 Tax=Pseudomonas aeruginosa TaxID=287 RepID=A0A643IY68_PSEAI|nr:hypothetical protein [Pseudomonas aeruginosa]KAB0763220.1 hypothetical protein F7O97_16955 [Pseudomonas aeruginosa]MBH8943841.1 hypothetical protein [Pseudomonas aeruginosa]MCW5397826.1 hypothetical protein [Pseudomonas aeruginosa]MCW5422331.1 hypothetical protein [Pseudomonas aeruginosa]